MLVFSYIGGLLQSFDREMHRALDDLNELCNEFVLILWVLLRVENNLRTVCENQSDRLKKRLGKIGIMFCPWVISEYVIDEFVEKESEVVFCFPFDKKQVNIWSI